MFTKKQKTVYKVKYDPKESTMAFLFVLPALAVYGLYNAFCVFMTFFYSFHKWSGISPKMDFIGIHNFITAFNDQGLMLALRNNIILVVVSLSVQIPLGMLLALLLASLKKGSKFFRTVYFMPMLLSTVATGLLWTYLYDPYFGLINAVLNAVGLSRWATAWLGQTSTALGAVFVVICWQYTPQYMILLRAGMTGIPDDIYEAAALDGAVGITRFFKITLPLLSGTIKTCATLSLVGSLKYFDLIYVMTKGGPGNATDVMATYMYKRGFVEFNMGYGSALAIFMLMVSLVLTTIFRTVTRHDYTGMEAAK